MRIKTTDIISKIQSDFHKKYKPFGKLKQEPIFKELINTVKDPVKMNYIIQRNNVHKEPPTETFLRLNPHIEKQYKLRIDQINEAIGAFWGFIFKFIFNLRYRKNVPIKATKVTTASYFYPKEHGQVIIVE